MALKAKQLALQAINSLRPLMPRIEQRDKSLAVQLRRAASSVTLNIAEGSLSDPGNRRARYFTAAGSANETRSALEVAVAWGYLSEDQARAPSALLDQVIAILWTITHRRQRR